MHSKDRLASALRDVGLDDMAQRAATGYYDDYLSPLDLPQLMLATELKLALDDHPDQSAVICNLRQRVINGDFDATSEESDAWAASLDGQDAFRRLLR
jgi:hypothetical protein